MLESGIGPDCPAGGAGSRTGAEPVCVRLSPIGRRQSWRQYAATTLTIAASFLLALVVGMGLSGNWSGGAAFARFVA